MLTLDSFYKREVPSRSVTSRDGELLIAGLHRFDLHRDLFHRVIERGLRRLLTGEAQFKRGVGRPHTSPISGMPGIATARADWMATALAFWSFLITGSSIIAFSGGISPVAT